MRVSVFVCLLSFIYLDGYAADYVKVKTIEDYTGDIEVVAYSPDGKYLAVGTSDTLNVPIFDTTTWKKAAAPDDNGSWVSAAAFTKDGKIFAAADRRNRVVLYSTATWKSFKVVKAGFLINSISLNQDGSLLAIVGEDGGALLWNVKDNKLVKKLNQHQEVLTVAFSPDNLHFATGGRDNWVTIWNFSGMIERFFAGHDNNVRTIAYSLDGKYLASGSDDNDKPFILWDVNTGKIIHIFNHTVENGCAVAFGSDNETLAVGDCRISYDITSPLPPARKSKGSCTIVLQNIKTEKVIQVIGKDADNYFSNASCGLAGLAFSPDMKYLVAGYEKGDRKLIIFERK
jgi:tricorn protease-like protein